MVKICTEVIIIKTLIELFDDCQIENVIAGLNFLPEKIVFVGFKETMTRKKTEDLKKFFKIRNFDVALEFEVVGRYDYEFIYNKLNEIIDSNEDCCFDLTGGKELVLTAMGAVSALRDVPMLQFNVRSGNLIKVKNCDGIEEGEKASMSIDECIVLNGGAVVRNDDFKWDMNEDFRRDIDIMWDICREKCGHWNRQAMAFGNFEKYGSVDLDYSVNVDLTYLSKGNYETVINERIIDALVKNGLITIFSLEGDKLTYKFKNDQVGRCISKAGNILELYVYKTAIEIMEEEKGYYRDVDMGVFVDWDGVIHDGTTAERDTRNEIDVLLMRGVIPIFVSCKNGEVRKEALYELSTVAERFGGEYAKKILLTTYVSAEVESRRYIMQRAHDMRIDIIEGVEDMDIGTFKETLRNRIK